MDDVYDEGLVTTIYKELLQLNNKQKKKWPVYKLGKESEQAVLPRRHANGLHAHEKASGPEPTPWGGTAHALQSGGEGRGQRCMGAAAAQVCAFLLG